MLRCAFGLLTAIPPALSSSPQKGCGWKSLSEKTMTTQRTGDWDQPNNEGESRRWNTMIITATMVNIGRRTFIEHETQKCRSYVMTFMSCPTLIAIKNRWNQFILARAALSTWLMLPGWALGFTRVCLGWHWSVPLEVWQQHVTSLCLHAWADYKPSEVFKDIISTSAGSDFSLA